MQLRDLIDRIPEGYTEGWYEGRRYGLSRRDFNGGKSTKVYARELGGTDFVSFNHYPTARDPLKPCEMPVAKVLHFLRYVRLERE